MTKNPGRNHDFYFEGGKRARLLAPVLVFCLFFSRPSFSSEALPASYSFTLPASYDEVWQAARMVLMTEYVPIELEVRGTGYLKTAEVEIQSKEYQEWTGTLLPPVRGYASFELKFIFLNATRTRLEVVSEFESAPSNLTGLGGKRNLSNGVFEKRLAARIHAYLVLKKYPDLLQFVTGCNFYWREDIGYYEVSGVEAAGFGAEQGFQNGDVVIQIDGTPVTLENIFQLITAEKQTREKAFFVDRGGRGLWVNAVVYYLPADVPWFGFRAERDLESGYFRIADVVRNSPAEASGLAQGDLLVEEEGVTLNSWHRYYDAMTTARLDATRHFRIFREGRELRVAMYPPSSPPASSHG